MNPAPCMADSLTVNLGGRAYPILFGADLAAEARSRADALAKAGRKMAVVTDRNLARCQKEALLSMFGEVPTWVAAPGEETKTIQELGRVLEFFAAEGLGRSAVVFAFGGGVIGDLAGFAAAS